MVFHFFSTKIISLFCNFTKLYPKFHYKTSQKFPFHSLSQNTMPHSLFCLILLFSFSSSFTPPDNTLISCGSTSPVSFNNRVFQPDSTQPGKILISNGFVSLPLYKTARMFTSDASYQFKVQKLGFHFVRLHFYPFETGNYDLGNAKFSVSGNGLSLLSDFNAKSVENLVIKEFLLSVNSSSFELLFKVSGNGKDFAFVNAIEFFSAPDNLILDYGAKIINSNGLEEFKNMSQQILETIHRVNVGGEKLTPFNDTLWRTWIPDNDFLVLKSAAKSVNTTHTPNYQLGGADRNVAPDNVYMTAQQMNKDNVNQDYVFNITWSFPVSSGGSRYLVRLHFCDIVSQSLNQLYFNVFVNGFLAYKDLDLSVLTIHVLASPYYLDFVVDSGNSEAIEVSVGPSDLSTSLKKNAILNGVEIMKMVDFVVLQHAPAKKRNTLVFVGSVVGGFGFLCFVTLAVLFLIKRNKKKLRLKRGESLGWTPLRAHGGSTLSRQSDGTALTSPNGYFGLRIAIVDIEFATNNFDKNLIIGSGGFGMVYKGVLRDNTKVAVKRGVPGSRQGLPEFHSEITVLSKIKHRHLVALVGYCDEQAEMILVYEYVEKGPLKNHLYGSVLPPLSWKQRLEICIGAARGLHYLHTGFAQGIIHRDIKSTNILLDEDYIAKVADFGLSRSGPCINETHVSTGVKGSFGYLDPEYFRRQQLTDKSDVYSFGVVLFEVLCARPAVDPLLAREQVNLAEWAMQWQNRGMIEQIIDPYLKGKIKASSLKKFGDTAEKCVAEYGVDRPTMGDVLWNLEHALLLQDNVTETETSESDHIDLDLSTHQVVRDIPSSYGSDERDEGDVLSDVSTSQVFSQLMTNKGR